jgi:calcineurin-like phosphoesterase family protein
MKRIAIPDIHGRSNWKEQLDYDEVYFLGDYFDSYDKKLNHRMQIENFEAICEEARKHPDKIHLCMGNHDFHYIANDPYERYSGFQKFGRFDIEESIRLNLDLLHICFVTEDKWVLSHAGLTKQFMKLATANDPKELDKIFKENMMLFRHAGTDPYGDDPQNGPLWVRPRSLAKNAIEGYSQIVGHTKIDEDFEEVPFTETRIVLTDNDLSIGYQF